MQTAQKLVFSLANWSSSTQWKVSNLIVLVDLSHCTEVESLNAVATLGGVAQMNRICYPIHGSGTEMGEELPPLQPVQ